MTKTINEGNYYQFTLKGKPQIGEARGLFIKFANHDRDNPIMIAMHEVAPGFGGIFPYMHLELLPPLLKKAGITYELLPSMKVFSGRSERIAYCSATNILLVPGAQIDLSEKTDLTRFILDKQPIQQSTAVGEFNLNPPTAMIHGRSAYPKIGCQYLTPTIMNKIRAFIADHSKPVVKKKVVKPIKETYLNIK